MYYRKKYNKSSLLSSVHQSSYLAPQTYLLSIYKLYSNQILIRSIQRHILKSIEIIDRRTGKYIKPHSASLTGSRRLHGKYYIQ